MRTALAPASKASAARYAVYWAPDLGSALERLAAAWFDDPRWQHLTKSPRHYGLHATLKPPFALADGMTETALHTAIETLAASTTSFPLPPLQLSTLDGFVALTPSAHCQSLDALAAKCVTELDHFRRPASAEETARRRAAGLNERQDSYLLRWGYPYVLEEFRFHVTLTERLDADLAATLRAELSDRLAEAIADTYAVGDLTLFVQPESGAPFHQTARFKLN